MIHFYLLPVKKVEKETAGCVIITFDVPDELKNIFRFKQGQNLTIRKELNGIGHRRNYSICSAPFDNSLQIAVKKVEGGSFSTYANEHVKAGDYLEVMPPTGKFYTELHLQQKKNYIAFAAGSGITPLLSIIKTTLATERQSTFTLVYGNRTKNSIIFKEELEAVKDKYMDRFRLYHILSREKAEAEINWGRIDKDKCEALFSKLIDSKQIDEAFLCGPEELIFSVKDFLEEKGLAQARIHFELFTIPGQKKLTVDSLQLAAVDAGPTSKISIKLDGVLFDFNLGYNSQSILDAALQQGADLPYACKGGVCTTCKARLREGEVVMDVNWGLEPDEVERGFILTCQAHPATEKVVVDFDIS